MINHNPSSSSSPSPASLSKKSIKKKPLGYNKSSHMPGQTIVLTKKSSMAEATKNDGQ